MHLAINLSGHIRHTPAEQTLHDILGTRDLGLTEREFQQRQKQGEELMAVLLNLIIEVQRLDKRRGIDVRHLAGVQQREQLGQLVYHRVLLQGLGLQREDGGAEGGVHVEALEDGVGVAGGPQVGQPGRRLGGLADILGGVRAEAADMVGLLLP